MKAIRTSLLRLVFVMTCGRLATAGEYDYFRNIRYPAVLRDDVSRDKIKQEGLDWCPAVILRLPDGRKRCFVRGSFSDEDQRYIVDIYEKEMKRITKTVEDIGRTTYEGANGYLAMEWYKPGTMTVESKHFTFTSNATSAPGAPSPWANPWDKKASERYRRATFRCFEDFWAYNE